MMGEGTEDPGSGDNGEAMARRILIVDDDEGLNNLAQVALRRAGYGAEGAFTGADAIERVMADPGLALLIDQRLPDMTGIELIRVLAEQGRKVPFVAMTGHGDEGVAVEMMKLGARDYLTKGFDLTDLLPEVFRRVFSEVDTEMRLGLAEIELEESQARMTMVLEGTDEGLWDWDVVTGDITFDDHWPGVLGYAPGERAFDFEWWDESIHPESRPAFEEALSAYLEGREKHYEIEYRLRDSAGEWRWIWARGICTEYDGEGKPLRMIGTHRDITGSKQAEEEKEKLQEQLTQAQKMEAVGRLAGGVAHDFNNMLSVILGNAQMGLRQLDPDKPLYEELDEIRKAALRSGDLTRQLLAFARRQTVTPEVLDLNETVEGMLKMLRRLIGEDLDLAWLPGAGLWPVEVDPSQIDQILANLCVNARDAIADVGKVTIETENTAFDAAYCVEHPGAEPGEYVLLAVSDDGTGMDGETLDRVFEPFFTTKEMGSGTGLGLATVYGIVKQSNGFIDVHSELGQGTTFHVYLPRHAGEAELAQEEALAEPVPRGHETILVVEDEPAILKMTTRMLEGLGYTVLATDKPIEAIRLAEERPGEIGLLMTDVVMPGMNGRDLADRLSSLCPGIKRLFVSGYTADVIAHRNVLDTGVDFLQKPFSMQDLAARMRNALDGG